MRILHVNKFLYRRGGAESYMQDLARLQTGAGHEVEFFGMQHPSNPPMRYEAWFPPHLETDPAPPSLAGQLRGFARMVHSTSARRGMAAVLDDFKPDVVHLHNIYHQLSPSILGPVASRGIPAVMTLHDYKLACPSYQFLDHGRLCQACLGGRFQHAVLRRCKGGSLAASAAVAVELSLHTMLRSYGSVRRFICPSRFLEGRMRAAGVFPDRLRHVPHFIDFRDVALKAAPGGAIAVASRLAPEKGIDVAIRAVAAVDGAVLDVAGTGPSEPELRRLADTVAPGRVRFHGALPAEGVDALLRNAAVVCVPSRWFENQPMVVLEALARGVPVVGSDLGGLHELVEPSRTGTLVAADDADALAAALRPFVQDPQHGWSMRDAARRRVESEFSPALHLERVHRVYGEAAGSVQRRAA